MVRAYDARFLRSLSLRSMPTTSTRIIHKTMPVGKIESPACRLAPATPARPHTALDMRIPPDDVGSDIGVVHSVFSSFSRALPSCRFSLA
jgi:hypothetical protein